MSKKKRALTGRLGALKVLFDEVIELIPEEQANKLIEGYLAGKTIHLFLGHSAHGKNVKTAFGTALDDNQDWRHLPTPVGGEN